MVATNPEFEAKIRRNTRGEFARKPEQQILSISSSNRQDVLRPNDDPETSISIEEWAEANGFTKNDLDRIYVEDFRPEEFPGTYRAECSRCDISTGTTTRKIPIFSCR